MVRSDCLGRRPIRSARCSGEASPCADRIWSEDSPGSRKDQTFEPTDLGLSLYKEVLQLAPNNEAQRFLQAKALDAISDMAKARLQLFTNAGGAIPIPFLAVLIGWLTLIFASISLLLKAALGPSPCSAFFRLQRPLRSS
jgi:hypothetical protein